MKPRACARYQPVVPVMIATVVGGLFGVVALALLALLLFGGRAIHSFTATMLFGVVLVGTYTSIFIASPVLIYLGLRPGSHQEGEAAKEQ